MRTLYIGGQKKKNSTGSYWKVYIFLILLLTGIGFVLKLTAPMIVENWINKKGTDTDGYAFSVRNVDLSLQNGKITLNDVKIFNPQTSSNLLETPNLTIQLDLVDLVLNQNKKVSITADKVDLYISKDLNSEIERMRATNAKAGNDVYLDVLDGKITKLNIIEKKEDQSRTMLELNDVNLKVKEVSLLSINKKSEFTLTSTVADGGKMNLTGKTHEGNGITPWAVHGTLKQIPSGFFNKIAGSELPFAFTESHLNAELTAYSDNGSVLGEITPEIKKLNLIQEKPGVPTQTIKRKLSDDLTFVLPFTLKDKLTVEYSETFQKLKSYKKYPAAVASNDATEAKTEVKAAEPVKPKKSFSFWSF
ncbi:hypothetical protein [Peredibacter starrii]|uniref:DUF748 domain-containing protein n=1 Tax=Peredibacter starrii TaxID=28202 RepID=A0AAX4HU83_9BACT|nr:hypothetical protein [Peredibacter starrii]WPU66541.1 hypothetical protein SOO65_07265 [Peredibacter starrii]